MTIAEKIKDSMEKSSLIRKMFEEGAQMKAKFGAENDLTSAWEIPTLNPLPASKRS